MDSTRCCHESYTQFADFASTLIGLVGTSWGWKTLVEMLPGYTETEAGYVIRMIESGQSSPSIELLEERLGAIVSVTEEDISALQREIEQGNAHLYAAFGLSEVFANRTANELFRARLLSCIAALQSRNRQGGLADPCHRQT